MSRTTTLTLLQEGIAAAKAGKKALARPLLREATKLAPDSELGWLWLAGVAESPGETVACLQRVLDIDPANKHALAGLKWARQQAVSPSLAPASAREETGRDAAARRPPPAAEALPAQVDTRRQAAAEPVAGEGRDEEPAGRGTVLVVDDSPTVCRLVSITLEKHGYQVIAAADGLEALAKINDGLPNLILLDIMMPRLDGYQLCKIIKGNDETKHIPVVMLSGKDSFFDKVRGRMAGSTHYITKPFEPDTLVHAVEKHVRHQSGWGDEDTGPGGRKWQ